MIQAYGEMKNGRSYCLLGLTRENLRRLTDHQPIRFTPARQVDEVLIVFGETKPDVIRIIEAWGGPQFEASHKAAAELDPT